MTHEYAVVDLFAGPGGLAEGFSSVRASNGDQAFRIALSIEKDPAAHATLLLRSFLRQFRQGFPPEYYRFLNEGAPEPDWSTLYGDEWETASRETLCLELGSSKPESRAQLESALDRVSETYRSNVILIGGPPCQAYSLVGRARNRGNAKYVAGEDQRHFLYREYISILDRLRPAVFVMENVKGLLSSSVGGDRVFDLVLNDFHALGAGDRGYKLVSLSPRSGWMAGLDGVHRPVGDYVISTEEFGVPQARHRVIVVGIRRDIWNRIDQQEAEAGLRCASGIRTTVRHVLSGMPKLRSGLSRSDDSEAVWRGAVVGAMARVTELDLELSKAETEALLERAQDYKRYLATSRIPMPRTGSRPVGIGADCPNELRAWILDSELEVMPNNETRTHMPSDFARYFFTSLFGEVMGISPKMRDFPADLAPAHQSWSTGKFSDRFRVQVWDQPSTTVTSHISKDGHYFIHPDPVQCRSLTVREAARLQTFPDNYFFKGNRTQQYIQVGNAVPPFLASKIAEWLLNLLGVQ